MTDDLNSGRSTTAVSFPSTASRPPGDSSDPHWVCASCGTDWRAYTPPQFLIMKGTTRVEFLLEVAEAEKLRRSLVDAIHEAHDTACNGGSAT